MKKNKFLNYILILALLSQAFFVASAAPRRATDKAAAALAKSTDFKHTKETIRAAADQLLRFEYRPSTRDFLRAFNGVLPQKNPFIDMILESQSQNGWADNRENVVSAIRSEADILENDSPIAIAHMEKAFPGASYFQLGRDGAIFSDVLEVFYDLLGQHDRVYRLFASGPTVRALNQKTGIEFLISNGLGARPGMPVLFIDNTYWNSSSQSYLLTKYVVKYLSDNGFSKAQIEQMVSTASTAGGWVVDSTMDDKKLPEVRKENYLKTALSLVGNLSSPFYSASFWHDSMIQNTKQLDDGRIVGVYTNRLADDSRYYVLAYMYEVFRIVSDPRFFEKVVSEAKAVGLEFKGEIDISKLAIKPRPQAEVLAENYELSQNELKNDVSNLIIERLSPASGSFLKSEESQQILNMIGDEKILLVVKEAYEIAVAKKSYAVSREHLDAALSKYMPASSDVFKKINFIVTRLPEAVHGEDYYSPNGSVVSSWLKKYTKEVEYTNTDLVQLMEIVLQGYKDKTFSSKDYRRLILRILAHAKISADQGKKAESGLDSVPSGASVGQTMPTAPVKAQSKRGKAKVSESEEPKIEASPELVAELGQALSKSKELIKMLNEKYELFLTSERFDQKAQKVYLALVSAGYLAEPEVSCEALLLMKEMSKKEAKSKVEKPKRARVTK